MNSDLCVTAALAMHLLALHLLQSNVHDPTLLKFFSATHNILILLLGVFQVRKFTNEQYAASGLQMHPGMTPAEVGLHFCVNYNS